jgi:hypothetical protein
VKHGWNSTQHYLDIHESILLDYTTKYADDIYSYDIKVFSDRIILTCEKILMIGTASGIAVRCDIVKSAELDYTRTRARTLTYSYNANIPRGNVLFRYCSPDPGKSLDPKNHHTFHHKHDFSSGKEIITQSSQTDWYHVQEFFDEVLKL